MNWSGASADTAAEALLLSQVEDASLNACAPREQLWVDGWIVRLSPGKARRGRCIHAVAPGRLPLEGQLERCQALYDAAGLPMVFRMTPYTQPPALDAELAALGFARAGETAVMVCRDLRSTASVVPDGMQLVQLSTDAFASAAAALRGSTEAQARGHASRMALSPVPVQACGLREAGGDIVAIAQATQEGSFVGLYDVHTTDPARNRGLATLLCQHLLSQCARNGAGIAYLQVESDNHAAQRVYRRLGFSDGYRYHYRQRG